MQKETQKRKKYFQQYRLKHKEHYRQWRLKNREYLRSKKKEYYQKNKDIFIKRASKWQMLHRDRRNLSSKKFREKYPEKGKIATANWFKKNPGKRQEYKRNRRNLEYNAEGSHTESEWLMLKLFYNLTCPSCFKKEPEIKLTEDHIIPLRKGGNDYIKNIQPLCRSCNSKKYLKDTKYYARI